VSGTPPTAGTPTPRRTVSIAAPVGEGAIDSFVRQKGRGVILALYTALRSIKLYPLENSAVQKALADLTEREVRGEVGQHTQLRFGQG